jgi:hypothetical protein
MKKRIKSAILRAAEEQMAQRKARRIAQEKLAAK